LRGLLPDVVESLDQQFQRAMHRLDQKPSSIKESQTGWTTYSLPEYETVQRNSGASIFQATTRT
jgi:hypothetical protein